MKGIVPSLNTPFLKDGSVDHCSLRKLVHHTIEAGCGGMLGLAVAGEHTTLSLDEKMKYIDTVSGANDHRIPLIISVTAADVDRSVELTKMASAVDATGICVQLPAGLDRQDKLGFLQDLAQHSPSFIMVQDLDWTGAGLALDEITYLFDSIDKFTWLKIETPQAGLKYSAVLEVTDSALKVCGGWAVTQLMDAMARKVDAFIPTGMEHVYVAIYRLYQSGNIDGARALFERALPILNFSNQHINISIQFFKQLRKSEGLFETDLCRISAQLDEVQQHEAQHALTAALYLNEDIKTSIPDQSAPHDQSKCHGCRA